MTEVVPSRGWKRALAALAGLVAGGFLATYGATMIAAAGGHTLMALWIVAAGFGIAFWGLLPTLDRFPPASPQGIRRHRRVARVALGFAALVELFFFSGLPLPPTPDTLLNTISLVALFAITVAAIVLLRRNARVANILMTLVIAWDVLWLGRFAWTNNEPGAGGPVLAVIALLLIAMTMAAVLARWSSRRMASAH